MYTGIHDEMQQGQNASSTKCNAKMQLRQNVNLTEYNLHKIQLRQNGTGTKRKWYKMQLRPNASVTKCKLDKTQMGPNAKLYKYDRMQL